MKTNYILKLFAVVLFSYILLSCEKKNETLQEGIILEFYIRDTISELNRLNCDIDNETKEISVYYMRGTKIEDYLMNFKLGEGVESFIKNNGTFPSNKEFRMRRRSTKEEWLYTIKYVDIIPIKSFKIYKDLDTFFLNVNVEEKKLSVFFPEDVDMYDYNIDYEIGEGITANLNKGSKIPNDNKFIIKHGDLISNNYELDIKKIKSEDLDPFQAHLYSINTGIIFKSDNFVIDKANGITTANVAIGGNSYDKDSVFSNFSEKGNFFELFFETNAQNDLVKNSLRITKIDENTKIIEFNVLYGARFQKRSWTYKYTLQNTISYTPTAYITADGGTNYNGMFNYVCEWALVNINGKKYVANSVPTGKFTTTSKRNIEFYQSKNSYYDLSLSIDTRTALPTGGVPLGKLFYAYIPFDADLSQAKIEFKFSYNFINVAPKPVISINDNIFNSLPKLDDPIYKSASGVPMKFNKGSAATNTDVLTDWKLMITEK